MEARNAWFEANSDQLNDNGERLIIKDNLDSQIYGPNVNMSDAYGVTDWYVPEGNTDGLQAVDDGAGNGVKVEINNMFEDWLDIVERFLRLVGPNVTDRPLAIYKCEKTKKILNICSNDSKILM